MSSRVLIGLAFCLLSAVADAQGVIVSPPVLVIDHRTRSGALELFNGGDRATEVSVELLFGYPVTDSLGHFKLATPPAGSGEPRDATAWLEVYPSRLTIPAGGRQTVRFLARPPATLADGEHYTRIAVTSKFAPRAQAQDSTTITTELSVEVRAVTTLLYRKGPVTMDLAIASPRVTQSGDTLHVRAAITPSGTAAFLGSLRFTLETMSGAVVASHDQAVSIYVPVDPLIRVPIVGVPPGAYRLRVVPVAGRGDVPAALITPLQSADGASVSVTLVAR